MRAFMTLISVCPPASGARAVVRREELDRLVHGARPRVLDLRSSMRGFYRPAARNGALHYGGLDVDPRRRVAQPPARAAGAHGEDLGEDRERRLGRRCRRRGRGPHGPEMRSSAASATPSSSSRSRRRSWLRREPSAADVERVGLERALQRRQVELVVVGEHDDRPSPWSGARARAPRPARRRAARRRSGSARGVANRAARVGDDRVPAEPPGGGGRAPRRCRSRR